MEKRVWRSTTPLRQFEATAIKASGRDVAPDSELAPDLLATLERRGVPWSLLFRMPSHELGELVVRTGQGGSAASSTRAAVGKLLHRKIHQVPRLQVEAQVQPLSRSVLRVELTLRADFQWPTPSTKNVEEAASTTASTGSMDFHVSFSSFSFIFFFYFFFINLGKIKEEF